jgi:hypothetical protein
VGTISDFKTDKNTLILLVRSDCEFCAEAQQMVIGLPIQIKTFVVFQSRISGKLQIRPLDEPPEDFPVLVDESEIPEVPCLYDPLLGQRMMGLNSIQKYLEDTGLI